MRLIALLLPSLLTLAACSGSSDAKPDTGGVDTDEGTDSGDTEPDSGDTDTDTDAPCVATVASITPADGATDVAIDGPIVVAFDGVAQSADITLSPAVAGEVTVAPDGSGATFTPSELLARDTAYSVNVSVCDDTAASSFSTVGEAVEVDIAERTYDVELDGSDLTWVSPSAGATLARQIVTKSLLFMVESADDASIDFVGAAGLDHAGSTRQYGCTEAIDFPAVSFASNPAFAIGPVDASLSTGGTAFSVYSLAMSARLSDDAESLVDVVVTGLLDARPITEDTGTDVCGLLAAMSEPCVACPDGEEACVYLEVHDESAPWREGLVLDPYIDPADDPYCE